MGGARDRWPPDAWVIRFEDQGGDERRITIDRAESLIHGSDSGSAMSDR